MTAAREVAWLALESGIGPADLLAAPASVYEEILDITLARAEARAAAVVEVERQRTRDDLRARLDRSLGR